MQARRFPQLQALLQYPSIVLQEYAPRPFLRAHARYTRSELDAVVYSTEGLFHFAKLEATIDRRHVS